MTDTLSSPDVPTATAPAVACRTVVAGLGAAGLECAAAIARHAGCSLAGFVEPRADLRRFARGAGFAVPAEATLARLLERTAADAIVVCTPREERIALVHESAVHGLDVLVDGLAARDEAEAARLEQLSAAATGRIACAMPALFHPLLRSACRVLDAGALGSVLRVRGSVYVSRVFSNGAPPEQGDVLDFAVAELLVLLDRLFGPSARVRATANCLYASRIDEVHAMLTLASGVEVGVDGSWSVPGYPHAALVVEVEGARGSIIVSDDAFEVDLLESCGDIPSGHSRRGIADEPDTCRFDMGERGRWLDAFVTARAGDAPLRDFDVARAVRVLRVLGAMRRSVASAGAECGVGA